MTHEFVQGMAVAYGVLLFFVLSVTGIGDVPDREWLCGSQGIRMHIITVNAYPRRECTQVIQSVK